MSLHRYAAKRDASEPAIIKALWSAGATVVQLSGDGVPDLLVGYNGITTLLECKTGKGKLTPSQQVLHDNWTGGPLFVVRTPDEALRAIGIVLSSNAMGE